MPAPVQEELIVPTAVRYLLRRQIDNAEMTTQYQLSQRMGIGVENIQSRLLAAGLDFFLVPLNGETSTSRQIAIYLRDVPAEMLEAWGYGTEHLAASISFYTGGSTEDLPFGEVEEVEEDAQEEEAGEPTLEEEVVELDPYAPYRIDAVQFEALREELMPGKELYAIARARGYSERAINRAVGGDRMVFEPVGPFWRPYVYNGKRWYLKEVLAHLDESDLTYKLEGVREKKRAQRASHRTN